MEEEQAAAPAGCRSTGTQAKLSHGMHETANQRIAADPTRNPRPKAVASGISMIAMCAPWWGLGDGAVQWWHWILFAAAVLFMFWAVRLAGQWGNAVELGADRIRLFRKERMTFELPVSTLEKLELNWSGLLLVWTADGRRRTLAVPANEFAPESWTTLTQSLRSLAGPRLRDTRRTLA